MEALYSRGLLNSPNDAIWQPHPENLPQQDAYKSSADEIGFGGSAGGGKTDLALGLAITKHKRSLILRRESTQLRGIIERSRDIIGANGKLNESSGVGRLPSGQIIEMGGCPHEHDKRRYQGRPHDLIVFDEACEFIESQCDFIGGWARTEDPNQHVQVLFTFNPPTSTEGQWIVRRFAPWLDPGHSNPAKPGELRWFARIDDVDTELASGEPFEHNGETVYPKSRTFIPARVDDNPYYRDSGYKAQLQALPEPLRSQMLYGDFTAGTEDDPMQVIPTAWVKAAQARWEDPATQRNAHCDCVGVDVARGGKDHTVIAKRYGVTLAMPIKYPGTTTPDGAAVAALVVANVEPSTWINIDVIGVGSSAFDQLRMTDRYPVTPVNVAEGSDQHDRSGKLGFHNVRSYIYWNLRELLDPVYGENIALPPSAELLSDLCAAKWSLTVRGILIEPKDDIKVKLGRSPDMGDAALLAFAPLAKPFEVADMLRANQTRESVKGW